MKHKRLNRDDWGFQYYPYWQMRIDDPLFRGLACLIRLTDGERNYWKTPKAGRVQVTGPGMTWLELVPDGANRVITVVFFPDGTHGTERINYPETMPERFCPSVWYVDIIEGTASDEYGIAVFIDKYLDVIFTPEGDIKVDDREELEAAFAAGTLSRNQYDDALTECAAVLRDCCEDIPATGMWCARVRQLVEDRIDAGEPVFPGREVLELRKAWTIRPITAEEAQTCSSVIRESFLTVAEEFGITQENAPRFTAFAVTEERVRRQVEEGRQVIACFSREGQMAGCYSLHPLSEDVCELNHLCVLPAFRHQHIGALLMRDALERAGRMDCGLMALSLVEENARLKRWYENFGFVSVGTEKFEFFPFTCGYMERRIR